MQKDKIYLLVIITLAIFCLVEGYYILTAPYRSASLPPQTKQLFSTIPSSNPIFQTQSAIIQGIIIGVTSTGANITNNRSSTQSFPFAANTIVYVLDPSTGQSLATTDRSKIEINKPVLINLDLINNQYQIISILPTSNTVLPPSPSPKPKK